MFVDTNILVYASVVGAPNRDAAQAALMRIASVGEALRISRQVLREFTAVISRPRTWARAQNAAEAVSAAVALAQDSRFWKTGQPSGTNLLNSPASTRSEGGRSTTPISWRLCWPTARHVF